ncbi:MAG: DUF3131 domain-containing protein [Bacteroidota bacterium]
MAENTTNNNIQNWRPTEPEPLSFKEGLLRARSHIIFILGLITAFTIIIKLEAWKSDEQTTVKAEPIQAPIQSSEVHTPREQKDFLLAKSENIPAPARAALSAEEKQWAQTAWKYFENNTNAETGLVNSVDNYASTTMWDMGSYFMALISAYRLEIIPKAEFDQRLDKALATLQKVPLFDNSVPNKAYNTATGRMTDYRNQPSEKGIGWSALDLGRFLVPMNIIVWNYPSHAAQVRGLLSRWNFQSVVNNGILYGSGVDTTGKKTIWQEGRLGYEQYAAKPFNTLGLDVSNAIRYDRHFATMNVNDIEIGFDNRTPEEWHAQNYVLSEPYILDGLEYGGDITSRELAWRIYRAQEERFKKTGILTAATEDHVDREPYFVYNTVFSGGQAWRCMSPSGKDFPELRSLSTKAAFGWHALYNTDYTKKLISKIQSLKDPARGWYGGVYENNNQTNKAISCNTNAVILEALAYKKFGQANNLKN